MRLYGVHRLLPKQFATISTTHDRPAVVEDILIDFILIDFTTKQFEPMVNKLIPHLAGYLLF